MAGAHEEVLRGNKAGATPRNGPVPMELGAAEGVPRGQGYV